MKIICLTTLTFISTVFVAETEDANLNNITTETARAIELENKSDYVADYTTDGKLDIGVGRTDKSKNIHYPIRFSLEDLESFFDNQRRKDLIVVIVAKNTWSDEEIQKHVSKLRDYFVARGYKKIVIQQGLGGGRGIHLEYETKNTAEQAAPRNR